MTLDALDHLVGGPPFPGVEHLLQQRRPVYRLLIRPFIWLSTRGNWN